MQSALLQWQYPLHLFIFNLTHTLKVMAHCTRFVKGMMMDMKKLILTF